MVSIVRASYRGPFCPYGPRLYRTSAIYALPETKSIRHQSNEYGDNLTLYNPYGAML